MSASRSAADYVTLTKPRLNFLVLLTTIAAYSLGSKDSSTLVRLIHTFVGTALVAGGASALNQVWERDTDSLMRRTRTRPPCGQLPGSHAERWRLLHRRARAASEAR